MKPTAFVLLIFALAAFGCNEPPSVISVDTTTDTGTDTVDAVSDVAPDADPDADPDVVPDADPDADPDVVPDADPDVVPDVVLDAISDVDVDVEPDADPDAGTDAGTDADPDADLDADPDAEPDVRVPGCGDGFVDPGEECDDGNDINTDACSNSCTDAFCGDGTMNAIPGAMVFGSPEVDAFGLVANVCDDGSSCPAGSVHGLCDVTDLPAAPEHGICQALGFDQASNVEWGDGEGALLPQLHHAYNWECFDYTCVESPFSDFSGDCSDFEMLSSIECFGIIAEECDDGLLNADAADACRTDCTLPICTDGIVDTGEECDDGNDVVDDGCSNACLLPQCGDAVLNGDEECDDGNDINDDYCRNDCIIATCGDAIVNPWVSSRVVDDPMIFHPDAHGRVPICSDGGSCGGGSGVCEVADLGTAPEHGICQRFGYARAFSVEYSRASAPVDNLYKASDWSCLDYECTFSPPGSGFVFCESGAFVASLSCETRGEEDCDEGEDNSDEVGATCRTDCSLPRCGDGVTEDFRGEECDDGNANNDDGCSNTCLLPRCGDTSIQGDEECDDGDDIDTNECRNDCSLHVCGDGFLADAEDCDDGELNSEESDASCRLDCRFPRCGDGVHDSGEECDDGNLLERDECLTTCLLPSCGDGYRHSFLGEECDDANDIEEDECRNDCTFGPLYVPFNVYGLPFDYFEWNDAAAQLIRRASEFEHVGSPMIAVTSDCVDTSGSTGSGSPGGSVSGEYNAVLAALRYAGVSEERLIGVASAAEASGVPWDVIIFPEFERCSPSAAAWRPVLEDALLGGARMIMAFPDSNATTFLNALGFAGSGSSGSITSPYPYIVAHTFGDGLPTITNLNATNGWSWAAEDLEVLAADASGGQAVWRLTAVFE